jgi:SAM-dependent methyltransferase
MRCLNSSPSLNTLEQSICESVNNEATHVAIVNAGDGRMARELQGRIGSGLRLSLVEPRPAMHHYLDDFSDLTADPWDFAWYGKQVEKYGKFDTLVFYQTHEFWAGDVLIFREILKHLKDDGRCWMSSLNSMALRFLENTLPPVKTSPEMLVHPIKLNPRLDYNTMIGFLQFIGSPVFLIWGLLDEQAYNYCNNQKDQKETTWRIKGIDFKIGNLADAFLWGASVVAFGFGLPNSDPKQIQTKFHAIAYNGSLFQSLLLPYPDLRDDQIGILAGEREISHFREGKVPEPSNFVTFFASEIANTEGIDSALLLGCGWGKDLLLLKKLQPGWKWTGADKSSEKIELGREMMDEKGVTTVSFDAGEPLPFEDGSFDVVITTGYFSSIYAPLAKKMVEEALRVCTKAVYNLESTAGPNKALALKKYNLPEIYRELGKEPVYKPVLANDKQTDMYLLTVSK